MIGGDDGYFTLKIGEQTAQAVMGMDDIRPEFPNRPLEVPVMAKIAQASLFIDPKIPALNAFFFQSIHLLRNKRGIMSFLTTGDNEYLHGMD